MAGTVLADTNVFARKFDQQQWAARVRAAAHPRPRPEGASRTRTRCTSGGSARRRPTRTTTRIIKGDVELMLDGLQLAGPNLTPADVPRRPVTRAPPQSTGPNDAQDDRDLRQPRLLAGHRLRRPRQRRHPLLGPDGRRPRRDRHGRPRACTGSSTAACATCRTSGPRRRCKLFDHGEHGHDLPGERRSRPTSCRRRSRSRPTRRRAKLSSPQRDVVRSSRGTVTQPSPAT